MKSSSLITLSALIALHASADMQAATPAVARFTPVQDAHVILGSPDANVGSNSSLYLQSDGVGTYLDERLWFQFDLADEIPAGATVVSAKLRLWAWSADSADLDIDLHRGTDDNWSQDAITWNTQPAWNTSPSASATLAADETGWVEIDVTSLLLEEYPSDATLTVMLKAATEGSDPRTSFAFNSRERQDGDYNYRLSPELRVQYLGQWTADGNEFTIFHINDMHSRLTPHDLDISEPNDVPVFERVGGAAYIASKLLELKAANSRSLVLDGGDLSEGNPLGDVRANGGMVDFYKLLDAELEALGGRGIDAVVVGNHDIRFQQMLDNLLDASRTDMGTSGYYPVISMNILQTSDGQPLFEPYVIVDIDAGLRVGILGFTTDDAVAELGTDVTGLEIAQCVWSDSDPATVDVKDYVDELRGAPNNCDVVVQLQHVGHRRTCVTSHIGDPNEKPPLFIYNPETKLPEVVIAGHWHTLTETVWQPAQLFGKTLISEAASYMQYIGEMTLTPNGKLISAQKHPIRCAEIIPHAGVENFLAEIREEYYTANPDAELLEEIVGYSATDLTLDKDKWWTPNEYPWYGDGTAGFWIADAMVWKAHQLGYQVDLAAQSGGGVRRDIKAGPITYLEIYETYPWPDDDMVLVTLTGDEIISYIEQKGCGVSISENWSVRASDGVVTGLEYRYDDDGDEGTPMAVDVILDNGAPGPNYSDEYLVAISAYMHSHENYADNEDFNSKPKIDTGVSIRSGVVEFTGQFTESAPYVMQLPRYDVAENEFAGGFEAVVTMVNDVDEEPFFEAAFVRLLRATDGSLPHVGKELPLTLVNPDGSINPAHQSSETMLYRSHLGLMDGYLKPGTVIEIWGEGGFYRGTPQLVDQEGVYAPDSEWKVLGQAGDGTYAADIADPVFMPRIVDFWDEAHENHFVGFYAKKSSATTITDTEGTTITTYGPDGFNVTNVPGTSGDILYVTGLMTQRDDNRAFRLNDAVVVASGYGPWSAVDQPSSAVQTASPLALTVQAGDFQPGTPSSGVAIAGTSFEEPTPGGIYTDTGDAATDHALPNHSGEAPVNHTAAGGELGFTSYYTNTRNGEGLTDGDYVGVTDYTGAGTPGGFLDGDQGFEISDSDGKMTVTLDTVSLTGYSDPQVTVDYFLNETTWETSDVLRIWVVVDGGTELDLLNTAGLDIDDDFSIEGAWMSASLSLVGYTEATLNFELDSNSSAESLYVDQVRFEDSVSAGSSDATVEVAQVELFYRYSATGADGNWGQWTSAGLGTSAGSLIWDFFFAYPQGHGFYEFRSVATDGDANTEAAPVHADTAVRYMPASGNQAPATPVNAGVPAGATGVGLAPALAVTVSDPDNDPLTVTFENANTAEVILVVSNVPSGQTVYCQWDGLVAGTSYLWRAKASDGTLETAMLPQQFTTAGVDPAGDDNQNGLPAVLETALGLDVIGQPSNTLFQVMPPADGSIGFAFPVAKQAGTGLVVEWSRDMANWQRSGLYGPYNTGVDYGDAKEMAVEVPFTEGDARGYFFRVATE